MRREANGTLLGVGVVLTIALTAGGWWADGHGHPFAANVLVELAGAFATLVLIDLLLPRAVGLLTQAQAGADRRMRRRMDDELAITEAAFFFYLGLESPSNGPRSADVSSNFDVFRESLEHSWGRQLTAAEYEALVDAIIGRMASAVSRYKEQQG